MAFVEPLDQPRPVVAIVGGAVAGSEAAKRCAERGAIALVFEQGTRPYGKIEDGLPRWHEKLRLKEYARVDANLRTPGVYYIPRSPVGSAVALATLREELGLSAVVLANGAWRDRPLPIEGVDDYIGKGLIYQNPFVYWFNHYEEEGFEGESFPIDDGSIVVGGGLASIDVAKIINLELYKRALAERGVETSVHELELKGVQKILDAHGVERASLGIEGCTLFYRRRKKDMPLASPKNDTDEAREKAEAAREKIMDRVMTKYLVRFEPLSSPVGAIVEDGRLVGLRFQRNRAEGRKLHAIDGETYEVRAPAIFSSIGSVPKAIDGIPMKGELYAFTDWETGELDSLPGVFGLGNVLTGQGNIKDSRENAAELSEHVVAAYLGIEEGEPETPAHERLRAAAERIAEAVANGRRLAPESLAKVDAWLDARWAEVGFDGRY